MRKKLVAGILISLCLVWLWDFVSHRYSPDQVYTIVGNDDMHLIDANIRNNRVVFGSNDWSGQKYNEYVVDSVDLSNKTISLSNAHDCAANSCGIFLKYLDGTKKKLSAYCVPIERSEGYYLEDHGLYSIEFMSDFKTTEIILNQPSTTIKIFGSTSNNFWSFYAWENEKLKSSYKVIPKVQDKLDMLSPTLSEYSFKYFSGTYNSAILSPESNKEYYLFDRKSQLFTRIEYNNLMPDGIAPDDSFVYWIDENKIIVYSLEKDEYRQYQVVNNGWNLRDDTLMWLTENEFVITGVNFNKFYSEFRLIKFNLKNKKSIYKTKPWHFFSTNYPKPSQYFWIDTLGFVRIDFSENLAYTQ